MKSLSPDPYDRMPPRVRDEMERGAGRPIWRECKDRKPLEQMIESPLLTRAGADSESLPGGEVWTV